MDHGYKKLKVYQLAYELAMKVFVISKNFPSEEKYSLPDQIRRSSRSVCANIAEAYRKRKYEKHFISKLTDSDSECSETQVWLDFSKDCGYLDIIEYENLFSKYNEVGKMLGSMTNNPSKFIIK